MLHRNHFPRFIVLTLIQVSYDHFCYNPKLELELDQCVERGVFKGNAKYRAQIAEVSEMVKAEMRELRESTRRK